MAKQENVKLFLDTKKEFKSEHGNITITRGDYESLPCGMIAIEFSDEQMQRLVDDINLTMQRDCDADELELLQQYRTTQNMSSTMTQDQIHLAEELSDIEFKVTEDTALYLGMEYYEDLTEESFEDICQAVKEQRDWYKKKKITEHCVL